MSTATDGQRYVTDSEFYSAINEALNNDTTAQELADIFMVSVPTIWRWAYRENIPYASIRRDVITTLEQKGLI